METSTIEENLDKKKNLFYYRNLGGFPKSVNKMGEG